MKYRISVILIIFVFLFSNAQQMIIQYEYDKQRTVVDSSRVTGMYFLSIDQEKSFFFSEAEYISDSIIHHAKENGKRPDFKLLPDDLLESFIIKHRNEKSITFYSNGFMENEFEYTEIPDFKWEITNETKNILGYKTIMAIGTYAGRDYKAYFTDKIPVAEGPYKFFGLPGLILEIGDTENLHHFIVKGLELAKTQKTVDLTKTKFVKTTRRKYFELRKQLGENPMQRMIALISSTGITETTDKNGNKVNLRKLFEDQQKSMQSRFNNFNQIEP